MNGSAKRFLASEAAKALPDNEPKGTSIKVTIDIEDVSVALDALESACCWFEYAAQGYTADNDEAGLEETELHALACGRLYIELRNAWLDGKEPE